MSWLWRDLFGIELRTKDAQVLCRIVKRRGPGLPLSRMGHFGVWAGLKNVDPQVMLGEWNQRRGDRVHLCRRCGVLEDINTILALGATSRGCRLRGLMTGLSVSFDGALLNSRAVGHGSGLGCGAEAQLPLPQM